MNKLHKSLLATAVAALIPSAFAVEAEMPSFHVNLDVSLAYKMAEEKAFALDDAPGDKNNIGFDGEVRLDNDSSLTYSYYQGVDLADQGGFGNVYQAYLGYRIESVEVRGGTLHTPLRRVMEKADLFSGTYADANNVFSANFIASNAAMILGGNDALIYAVSLDFLNENANDPDALDGTRLSAMVDLKVSESLSIAGGIETFKDAYTSFGVTAQLSVENGMGLVAGFELDSVDNANPAINNGKDFSPIAFLVGGYLPLTDNAKAKAQLGYRDSDIAGTDEGMFIAVGYEQQLAEAVTGYFLLTTGTDGGLSMVQNDSGGSATVLATGLNVTF